MDPVSSSAGPLPPLPPSRLPPPSPLPSPPLPNAVPEDSQSDAQDSWSQISESPPAESVGTADLQQVVPTETATGLFSTVERPSKVNIEYGEWVDRAVSVRDVEGLVSAGLEKYSPKSILPGYRKENLLFKVVKYCPQVTTPAVVHLMKNVRNWWAYKDYCGRTVFHWAMMHDRPDICELLVKGNDDVQGNSDLLVEADNGGLPPWANYFPQTVWKATTKHDLFMRGLFQRLAKFSELEPRLNVDYKIVKETYSKFQQGGCCCSIQ